MYAAMQAGGKQETNSESARFKGTGKVTATRVASLVPEGTSTWVTCRKVQV